LVAVTGVLTINRNRSALPSVLACLLIAANPAAQAEEATPDRMIPYSTDGPLGADQRGLMPDGVLGGNPVSICHLIESAAAANGLPFEFFALAGEPVPI
jgi:hypothetical protein